MAGPLVSMNKNENRRTNVLPQQRIIITGGPGAGKTTLLHALSAMGYIIVNESARAIIRDRRSRGLSPRPLPLRFAQEVLQQDIEKYNYLHRGPGPVFFDRGILDALCMLDQVTPLQQSELRALVAKYPYCRQVFILPPWQEIYTSDTERDQTFSEAIQVHEALTKWYRRCKYKVIEVPRIAVDERCAHILRMVASRSYAERSAPR